MTTSVDSDENEDKKCPNCGYCPTCGRANNDTNIYIRPYPYYPWAQTYVTWGTYTSGNTSTTTVKYLPNEATYQ